MTTPKRVVRSALTLLAVGTLALTACAPTQSVQSTQPVQVLSDQPLSPYATRADAAVLVFQTKATRAGAVDLLVDGTSVVRQLRPTDTYRVVALAPGLHTLSVRNTLSGTPLESTTANLQAGQSYALLFDTDPTSGPGIAYRLRIGQGSDAIDDLIGPF